MTNPHPVRRFVDGILPLLCVLAAAPVAAEPTIREVTLPIRPDTAYLRQAIVSQVFTGQGESVRVWDDGSGCNFLVLSNPRVKAGDEVIRLRSAAEARVGKRVGERCIVLTDWSGTVETTQTVTLDPDGQSLRFTVVDSRLQDEARHAGVPLDAVWDRIKKYVHPRLDAVRIDLGPALEDLKAVLRLVLNAERNAAVRESLNTIAPRSVSVVAGGLFVELGMQVPEAAVQPEPRAAESLTPAELARFESAWQGWDGFVTFVVKYFAAGTAAPELKRELLDVLIEARYDLVKILSTAPENRAADPVRALFVETWTRLAPVLRKMSPNMPRERALNLLSFVTAADALHTLDQLGPELGLDISLDGLRRMARILAPDAPDDPLQYDERVDPQLRELFDFGPPLRLRPDTNTEPRGWWRGVVPNTYAGVTVDEELADRLNRWVPSREELEPYLQSVHRLLDATSRSVAEQSELDPDLHGMYRALVLATAWQETCWRQYKRVDGKIVPILSPAGAVGMMQVVPNVWRGFYDRRGLTEDIAYNVAAGGEILMHYLLNYAIRRGEDKQPGGRDNLARATYAAYNGGPRHLRRYRRTDTSEQLRDIDLAFQEKYKQIRAGDELAVRDCYTG